MNVNLDVQFIAPEWNTLLVCLNLEIYLLTEFTLGLDIKEF